MKKTHKTSLRFSILLFVFLLPILTYGQTTKDVEVILECVEYVGHGIYKANFGYYNPNYETITVNKKDSRLIYNGFWNKKYGPNTFDPGRHAYVFSRLFPAWGRLKWRLKLPNGNIKEVVADANSIVCTGDVGYVESYYAAPEG